MLGWLKKFQLSQHFLMQKELSIKTNSATIKVSNPNRGGLLNAQGQLYRKFARNERCNFTKYRKFTGQKDNRTKNETGAASLPALQNLDFKGPRLPNTICQGCPDFYATHLAQNPQAKICLPNLWQTLLRECSVAGQIPPNHITALGIRNTRIIYRRLHEKHCTACKYFGYERS